MKGAELTVNMIDREKSYKTKLRKISEGTLDVFENNGMKTSMTEAEFLEIVFKSETKSWVKFKYTEWIKSNQWFERIEDIAVSTEAREEV